MVRARADALQIYCREQPCLPKPKVSHKYILPVTYDVDCITASAQLKGGARSA